MGRCGFWGVVLKYDISIAQMIDECKTEKEREAMRKMWDEFLDDPTEYDIDNLCAESGLPTGKDDEEWLRGEYLRKQIAAAKRAKKT